MPYTQCKCITCSVGTSGPQTPKTNVKEYDADCRRYEQDD